MVGYGYNSNNNNEAFRWTAGSGMVGLGFLGTGTFSNASAVSADGSTVVGYSRNSNNNPEAFRWTAGSGMVSLGFLGTGTNSYANAVSADGGTVVGYGTNSSNHQETFRWSTTAGMQSISQWLNGAGVTIPTGWQSLQARGVSADGNVVVGSAQDGNGITQAWLARVGPASGLITNMNAFNNSLIETASRGIQAGAALSNLTLFGAHHRSILDNGLARTTADSGCGWATADGGHNTNTDNSSELTEIGICKDFDTARIGVGVGQAWTQQDLSLNGSASYDGQYLLVEAANTFENGLEPSVTGYYGRYDTQMSRHYANGASVDSSKASPDAAAYAVRARLDWKDAAAIGKFSLSPYVAYTWSKTKLDAYTETGGGFPAQFGASSWSTDDLRFGSATKISLSNNTDLRLGLEGVHRFDDNTSGIKASVIGLSAFNNSLPGQQVTQTWAHTTADVDCRLTEKLALTTGASAATRGGDATWSLTAGLRANF